MKKILCILLVMTMLLLGAGCGSDEPASEPAKSLQVGFGRENVMPEEITDAHLGGDDDAFRRATGFWDYVKVTCIAIQDGTGERVLVYTMDTVNSNDSWLQPIRDAISRDLDIPHDRIMIAATHNHSGVSMSYNWNGSDRYKTEFQKKMVKAGEVALNDLSPATISYGSSMEEDLVFVRHYLLDDGTVTAHGVPDGSPQIIGHAAEKDAEMQVVRFARSAPGKKDIIMMCFNPHTTYNGSVSQTNISADFPGACRDYIETQGDYLVAYFIGDAGNQSPISKHTPEMHHLTYMEYGKELGTRVLKLLPNLKATETSDISVSYRYHVGTRNKEKMDMVEQAREVVAAHESGGREKSDPVADRYGLYGRLEAYSIISRLSAPDTENIKLAVMALGDDLSFLFAPYEMFSEDGSYMRANTPYDMTFIASCANGAKGYLPSATASAYGCYEGYTTRFARGTGRDVAETFLDMLAKMKEGVVETIPDET